jgi:ABC-type Fe3+-siderophore transport system permease subunit
MTNKQACIVGSVLSITGLYGGSYLLHLLMGLIGTDYEWLLFPTIIFGSVFMTFSVLLAYGGWVCLDNEFKK